MNWLSLLTLLGILLFLNYEVDCQDDIPATENPKCVSEGKLKPLQILKSLLNLETSVSFLSGNISDLDRRVRAIENQVTNTEGKTTQKISGLKRQLQDLSGKVTAEGVQSRNHEQSVTLNLMSLDKEINSTIFLIRGLEEPLAEIQNRTQALLEERKVEQANNTQMGNRTEMRLLTGAERIAKIEMILKDPKATFTIGEELEDDEDAVHYDSNRTYYPGGCDNVYEVKSMRVAESCVRVFIDCCCRGVSRSVYPQANSGNFINLLTPEFPQVDSIGPCLPNEFRYANVSLNGSEIAITKDKTNVHQVPDIADFMGENEYYSKSTSVDSSSNSVVRYYMDEQGRPKWIEAKFDKRHINEDADMAVKGLAIPPGLGGPTNETYNSFPQSQRNFEEWKQITDQILSNRRTHPYLSQDYAYLTFVYESSAMAKPYGFFYWVALIPPGSSAKSVYGFVEN